MMQIFETFSDLAEALQGKDDQEKDRQPTRAHNTSSEHAAGNAEPRHERETLFERISDLLGE